MRVNSKNVVFKRLLSNTFSSKNKTSTSLTITMATSSTILTTKINQKKDLDRHFDQKNRDLLYELSFGYRIIKNVDSSKMIISFPYRDSYTTLKSFTLYAVTFGENKIISISDEMKQLAVKCVESLKEEFSNDKFQLKDKKRVLSPTQSGIISIPIPKGKYNSAARLLQEEGMLIYNALIEDYHRDNTMRRHVIISLEDTQVIVQPFDVKKWSVKTDMPATIGKDSSKQNGEEMELENDLNGVVAEVEIKEETTENKVETFIEVPISNEEENCDGLMLFHPHWEEMMQEVYPWSGECDPNQDLSFYNTN